MKLNLSNKVVLITGANGGIGAAIAMAFIEEGALVLAGYRGNISKLDSVIAEIPASQRGQFVPISLNLDDIASCKRSLDEAIQQYSKIDVLVNCAGVAIEKPFLLTDFSEIDAQVSSNFSAPIKLTQLVLKEMIINKNGAIINVSSILGSRFGRGVAAYAASKAALERFTQALALEVGRKGIRVNAVCPGMIQTKMTNALQQNMPPEMLKMCPIARAGYPTEVAHAVLFLASETSASYITGTTLVVDGGMSI